MTGTFATRRAVPDRVPELPASPTRPDPCFIGAVIATVLALAVVACATRRPVPTVTLPPAALTREQVPQFICFGTDDNGYSGLPGSGGTGALHFLTELFEARRNPPGSGNRRTFDGSPLHYSFYVNTRYITPAEGRGSAYASAGGEDPVFVRRAWKEALDHGHEIGVHTHSHPHGRDLGVRQWEEEMQRAIDILARPYEDGSASPASGMGVPRSRLLGFRTPYLEYGDHTLEAVERKGFRYDCSIEEGFQDGQDGSNNVWPYTLDHGSPGNRLVASHPGLWEIPVYAFVVPPDEDCERYGVPSGLRSRLKRRRDYFEVETGKVTGMDWNLWLALGMSRAEVVATLKHSLDQRLKGNRSPMTVGLHADLYSDKRDDGKMSASVEERQAALREFLDHALRIPQVRVVSHEELLSWLEQPSPLR
jgi:hypothetical protein